MIAIGGTVGLAEWIIDDTCLVLFTMCKCVGCAEYTAVAAELLE